MYTAVSKLFQSSAHLLLAPSGLIVLQESLAWLAFVTCAMCFENTGGAVCLKELTWTVLPMAIEETSYRVWILARADAVLNGGVVDNFQLAISLVI